MRQRFAVAPCRKNIDPCSDLGDPDLRRFAWTKPVISFGGSTYVMIIVDDSRRFKVRKLSKRKNGTTTALKGFIADYFTLVGLKSGAITIGRTMTGSSRALPAKIDALGITHQRTPADTPQYNGVTKRALLLDLLREKAITLITDLAERETGANIQIFRAEAWSY